MWADMGHNLWGISKLYRQWDLGLNLLPIVIFWRFLQCAELTKFTDKLHLHNLKKKEIQRYLFHKIKTKLLTYPLFRG
jgi:hypothetical protein